MYAPQGTKELPSGTENNLAGIALLRDQPEATVRGLEKISRWYSCPRGVQVLDRTDSRRDVYFIVEGAVRVIGHAPSGQEIAFKRLHAGDHFGELSAIDGEPRSATLYALEDSVLAASSEQASCTTSNALVACASK